MKYQKQQSDQTRPKDCYKIEGFGVIEDVLRHAPELLKRIYIPEKFQKKTFAYPIPQNCQTIYHPQDRWSAEVVVQPYHEQDLFLSLDQKDQKPGLILACDHLTDGRNLGAILRSCGFFGVPWVIIPKDRQVSFSQWVIDTAQGGFAATKVCQVVNLSRCLEQLKSKGYWILGADMDGEPAASICGFYDHACLILGAEDRGLSPVIKKQVDRFVRVSEHPGYLDSLNVSVAASILISHLQKKDF